MDLDIIPLLLIAGAALGGMYLLSRRSVEPIDKAPGSDRYIGAAGGGDAFTNHRGHDGDGSAGGDGGGGDGGGGGN